MVKTIQHNITSLHILVNTLLLNIYFIWILSGEYINYYNDSNLNYSLKRRSLDEYYNKNNKC